MKSPTQPFRKAVVACLGNQISYMNAVIPVCDEYRNVNPASLNIGNNERVQAWIQLQNMTSEPANQAKCMRNDSVSLQIQVRVSFNANTGNFEHSENIMDLVLDKLFPDGCNSIGPIISAPFHIWKLTKESDRNIPYKDNTASVWMKNVTIQAWISQN